jgi:hypothetical protein
MKVTGQLSSAEVMHEFLLSEWYKDWFRQFEAQGIDPLRLDPTDTMDAELIMTLLSTIRGPILAQLPNEIDWKTAELEEGDFGELLVIKEAGWANTFGANKSLKEVAGQIHISQRETGGVNIPQIIQIKDAIGTTQFEERIILIAARESGPYTLLDGNHRAVAFQMKADETGSIAHLPTSAILGVSKSMRRCAWLNFR